MKKKIFIIVGHPSRESLCKAIGEKYSEGALSSERTVRICYLSELNFNPNLENGYKKEQQLEKGLLDFQENILWADHLVWIYPIWWGSFPAKLKGLIDRTILPGFAYKFEKRSILPKRFLKGKSARIITTRGGSRIFYFGSLSFPGMIMRRFILNFTGFFPIRIKNFYSTNKISKERSEKIFRKVFRLGKRGK